MTNLQNGGIVEWLAEACKKFPKEPAIEYRGSRMTYAELDVRTRQIACALRREERGAGTVVGVLIDEPVQMVLALVGILRAGHVFVPLDTQWPLKRLRNVVENLGPGAFLVEARHESLAVDL